MIQNHPKQTYRLGQVPAIAFEHCQPKASFQTYFLRRTADERLVSSLGGCLVTLRSCNGRDLEELAGPHLAVREGLDRQSEGFRQAELAAQAMLFVKLDGRTISRDRHADRRREPT